MRVLNRFWRPGLAVKLAVYLLVSTGAIFAGFGMWNLRAHRLHAEALVGQDAYVFADVIQRSIRYHMMRNDRAAIERIVSDIGSEPGIIQLRIADQQGIVRFSTNPLGTGSPAGPRRDAMTRLPSGDRVLNVQRPIPNQASCSEASCHVHPASQRVLGTVDTQLSLASVDHDLASQQAQLLRFTVVALVLILFASLAFVYLVVHRRVRTLQAGTRRVAAGDLSYRLPPQSPDELGELAESFNQMTGELERARRQLIERTERSLMNSEKMASLGKLAATVAHELNNPLFGILTYARLASRQLAGSDIPPAEREKLADKLSVIERESRRSGDIVRNLMTFARQAPQKMAPCQLSAIIDRAVAVVRHRLELQGIALDVQHNADAPNIVCDEGQVQQVVLALVVNAIEAMPGGGSLTISSGMRSRVDAVFSVRDTGGGIPLEVMPHVFEPFFTTKSDMHGSGLGLAVAHGIVAQHGGEIEVSSEPGKGTVFTVSLPVARDASESAQPVESVYETS